MLTVHELAALVGRKVPLRRIGRERYEGLCVFHQEKTPSMHIWKGRRGEGRYRCHGCGADGDGIDWLRKVEGEHRIDMPKPDPAAELRREQELALEIEYQEALDRHPELPEEARLFLEPDLGARLRRLLKA